MENAQKYPGARYALIAAGVLFGLFMFFHPENNPAGAAKPLWVPVKLVWLLATVLLIYGLPVLRGHIAGRSRLGAACYTLAWLGAVLSLTIVCWDAFIIPSLVAANQSTLIFYIEGESTEPAAVAFRSVVFFAMFAFSAGFLASGLLLARDTTTRIAGLALGLGAPTFWIGSLMLSQGPLGNSVTIAGAVLFGAGLAALAWKLDA